MLETAEAEFPALFRHKTREDWGVGVLSGERDGKRTYLFEGGEERVMGRGTLDMMMKVAPSTADLRSTLARLTALVARRHGLPDAAKGTGAALLEQISMMRRAFPQGLQDPAWQSERHAAGARDALVARAQDLLSLKSLESRLKAQQFDALWASTAELLASTGWVPADQLKPVPALGLGLLAGAVRELLYGSATLEQRVDRFSIAFETAFQRPARWETTTSLLCLVFPDNHVLVDLACFRKQLKLMGAKGTLPASPKGAAYTRCLNAARVIASKLAEQGEAPTDLLDVHDFVRFTCKATPPARRPKLAKAPKKQSRAAEAEAEAETDSD